jgi:glycosidase
MYSQSIALLGLALALAGCGESSQPTGTDDPPPPPAPTGNFTFTYTAPSAAPPVNSISVRGSFNGWAGGLMARASDGAWTRLVDLPDGDTQYKFFINGDWVNDMCYDQVWGHPDQGFVVDPDADACTSDGYEGQNAVITLGDVPLEFRHNAQDPVHLSVANGRLSVRFRAREGQVESARLVAGTDTVPMHHQLTANLADTWRGTLDRSVSGYEILVTTSDSTAAFGPYTVPAQLFTSVDWVSNAVGYQIFPERFWNGDPSNDTLALGTDEYVFRDPALGGTPPTYTSNWSGGIGDSHCCHQYFGGDLQGILDRLDYLQELGVTTLYLNPIFSAGSAHGYDTFDYLEVASNFGDEALLATLRDQAHARGMKIIWDFVPNHVGIGHPAFQDAVRNGESSPYWDWFEFYVPVDSIQVGNGEHYEAWWGFGSLPELQTRNPDVMAHLLEVAEYWTSFGLDGIRVDVPGEIENRFSFFPAWRQAVKAIDPDVYLVGEIWEKDPSWLRGTQFDALMGYALGEGIVEHFARGERGGPLAARELAALYADYAEASVAMSFNLITSHDNDRLLTKMGGGDINQIAPPQAVARHRLAAAVLYAVPGMPMTFQGDECGFLGSSDSSRHTARYPMQWDDCDMTFHSLYVELGELKRTLPALASGTFRSYPDAGAMLAFYRGEPGPGELLATFNNGSGAAAMTLPGGSWVDAVSGESFTGTVSVPGMGWRYLVRE